MTSPPEKTGVYTLGDIARRFGCKVWMVRRLYERDLLPPALRIGVYRVVKAEDLPTVEAALRTAGYLGTGQASRRKEAVTC